MNLEYENSLFTPPGHHHELFLAVQAYAAKEYGRPAIGITISLSHGRAYTLPVPAVKPAADGSGPGENWEGSPVPLHLTDFQLVWWPGYGQYRFTKQQAKAFRLLYEAWRDGTRWVTQAALVAASGSSSESGKASELFRRSEAWGTLIVHGGGALYRLADPRTPTPPAGETHVVPPEDDG